LIACSVVGVISDAAPLSGLLSWAKAGVGEKTRQAVSQSTPCQIGRFDLPA